MPTYNRARYLAGVLRHLADCIKEFSFPCEILIGDNASTDDTQSVLKNYAASVDARCFRRDKNIGAAQNILQLFEAARGRYVVYLADDDLLIPSTLGEYIAYLEENSDVGAVFAPWYEHDKVTGQDLAQFYSIDRDVKIPTGAQHELLMLLVNRHIFPEIYVGRTELVKAASRNANDFAFFFFVQAAAMLDRSSITFMRKPFYRSVTRHFVGDLRSRAGQEQTKDGWDCYRGGLEYILAKFAHRLSANDLANFQRGIDVFARVRMHVGLRLRVNENSNWIDAYYIANRLRCHGDDSLLSVSYDAHRANAALEYVSGLQPFLPGRASLAYFEDDPPLVLSKLESFLRVDWKIISDRSAPLPDLVVLLVNHRNWEPSPGVHVISEAELLARFP